MIRFERKQDVVRATAIIRLRNLNALLIGPTADQADNNLEVSKKIKVAVEGDTNEPTDEDQKLVKVAFKAYFKKTIVKKPNPIADIQLLKQEKDETLREYYLRLA